MTDLHEFACQIVSGLRKLNENYSLRGITNEIYTTDILKVASLQTENVAKSLLNVIEFRQLEKISGKFANLKNFSVNSLAFEAQKACDLLRMANESRLMKKLTDFEPELKFIPTGNLVHYAHNVVKNLEFVNETKIVSRVAELQPINMLPTIDDLKNNAEELEHSLVEISDLRMLKKIINFAQPLLTPTLRTFGQSAKLLRQWLKSVNKIKTLSSIFLAEQKRKEIISDCLLYAEWAGDDLKKWERVFDKFKYDAEKLKILESKIELAHSKFGIILSDTQKLEEIRERCGNDPFLQHEYGILHDKVERYHDENKEQEKVPENEDSQENRDRKPEDSYRTGMNFKP